MAIHNPKGPHHVEHETGGSDALTALSGAVLTTGTVPDARLSANVPLLNAANAFTANQSLQKGSPILQFTDTLMAANARVFYIADVNQVLQVIAANDALGSPVNCLLIDRLGNVKVGADLYEKGRPTAMGHWIDVPFSAANFTGSGGMTWTVTAGQVGVNRYTLIGKTMIWEFELAGSTIGGTPGATITMTTPLPTSVVGTFNGRLTRLTTAGTPDYGAFVSTASTVAMNLFRGAFATYLTGTLDVVGTIIIPLP